MDTDERRIRRWKKLYENRLIGSGFRVQGSTFRIEKTKTARIKGIVSSSGYKSASLNGVRRVLQILNNYGGSVLSVVAFKPLAQTWHVKMW